MRYLAPVLALMFIAALPGVAGAGSGPVTEVLKGKTSQNLRADVRVGQDAQIVRVAVKYKARCRRSVHRGRIVWRDEDGEAGFQRDADFFSFFDSSTTRVRRKRAIVTSTVTGEPANGGGYEGQFRLTIRVSNRSGRTIDTCRTGTQTYRVSDE